MMVEGFVEVLGNVWLCEVCVCVWGGGGYVYVYTVHVWTLDCWLIQPSQTQFLGMAWMDETSS